MMKKHSQTSDASEIRANDEVLQYVAERIKLIRKIRKVTMNEMANSLGITRKQLQNYESAQTNIGISRLWQIAQLMQVDIGFFIEGLNKNKPVIDNEDLNLIKLFNGIKDPRTKAAILGLLKEI